MWCDGVQDVFGEWHEVALRSLMTLKGLTYAPTGGIVAAATTSIPEDIGGVRNWDYRYCWVRDATLTLDALIEAGCREAAVAWLRWLVRATAGAPEQLQIMYGPAGERRLTEFEVDWLPGYEGSRPVRIGNAASNQFQLDVYGELMDARRPGPSARYRGLRPGVRVFLPTRRGLAGAAGRYGLRRTPLVRYRQRHLGGARPPTAFHPLAGHGVGGLRSGRTSRGALRPGRTHRAVNGLLGGRGGSLCWRSSIRCRLVHVTMGHPSFSLGTGLNRRGRQRPRDVLPDRHRYRDGNSDWPRRPPESIPDQRWLAPHNSGTEALMHGLPRRMGTKETLPAFCSAAASQARRATEP